jgi:hypothetical protein
MVCLCNSYCGFHCHFTLLMGGPLFFTLHKYETLFQSHNSWINSSYIRSMVNKLKKCLLEISLKRQLVGACPQVREYMKPHQKCRLWWFTLGVFFSIFWYWKFGEFFQKICKIPQIYTRNKKLCKNLPTFFVEKKTKFIQKKTLFHSQHPISPH